MQFLNRLAFKWRARRWGVSPRACAVFAVSDKSQDYIERGAAIAIESLRRSNPDLPVVVLHSGLDEAQRRILPGCELHLVETNPFERSERAHLERPDLDASVFLRFAIGDLVDYDIAIYLDSDLVVLDSLDPLLALEGVLMCRNMPSYMLADQFVDGQELLAAEGLSESLTPVNAGVMRIDLNWWRSFDMPRRIRAAVARHGWNAFAYCDQSLINLVGYRSGRLAYLPTVYNYMMWPDMQESAPQLSRNIRGLIAPHLPEGHARIVHWTGPLKPWHEAFRQSDDAVRARYCGACYDQFVGTHP